MQDLGIWFNGKLVLYLDSIGITDRWFCAIPKPAVVPRRYVQCYETASKRAFVISIAFGLMSQPIKFRFSSLQTTAVVPLPK